MLTDTQVSTMLSMQNKMNKTIDPKWATLGWDYMRAAALETAEAIEHHGWKWWKAQKTDIPQLQMELIDIWHFYLSRYLQLENGDETTALKVIMADLHTLPNTVNFDKKIYNINSLSTLEKLDIMTGLACSKRFSLGLFFSLCKDVNLTIEEIYSQYIQKNTLNLFRQEHGYKQGKYHKEWFGKEDNVYLVEIASKLKPNDPKYAEKIWDELEKVYAEALKQK